MIGIVKVVGPVGKQAVFAAIADDIRKTVHPRKDGQFVILRAAYGEGSGADFIVAYSQLPARLGLLRSPNFSGSLRLLEPANCLRESKRYRHR